MIRRTDLLSFPFYKKEKFTGSFRGMRYLIQKNTEEETLIFEVFTWPGPYGFAATDDGKKTRKTFPFEAGALDEITEYLNDIYGKGRDFWPERI